MFERLLTPRLRATPRSVLLLGPRQVGKSTLLGSMDPDLVVNLADPGVHRRYLARPERLLEILEAAPKSTRTVFIDEVQKVPALLDALQVVLDSKPKRFRFLLSGSSARRLKRGQANLLPGRLVVYSMHPLLERELGDHFKIERALAHGTLPATWTEDEPDRRAELLRSYADVYLREEVQAEALVRDLGGYARMLDFVAAASGTIVNVKRSVVPPRSSTRRRGDTSTSSRRRSSCSACARLERLRPRESRRASEALSLRHRRPERALAPAPGSPAA